MSGSIVQAVARIKRNVAELLTAESIRQVCCDSGHIWRERELGPATTVWAFLLQVLYGNTSCAHVVRLIDSQSVKTTESGGPRGFDAGKKIKGRKRHIVTDTEGHLVGVQVHAADIQDRDGAPDLLASIRSLYPWLRHIFADGGYAGDKLRDAMAGLGQWTFEIIKRSDTARGFELLPRRWVVERTFAWLGRCRRLAKDFEASIESAVAWTLIAHIRRLTRRLVRA